MKLISTYKIMCAEQQVELESKPVRVPDAGSYIEKSGTLWCVRSKNPNDKNFGCYASREEAESHLRTLNAGGEGSGCNPEVANPRCGRPSSSESHHDYVNPMDAPAKGKQYVSPYKPPSKPPETHTIEYDDERQDQPVDAQFMRLTLNDHSFPYLFGRDNLHWSWTSDRKKLIIETWDKQVGGLQHKDVYEVPSENVKEWQYANGQRDDYKQAMAASAMKKYRVKATSQYGNTGWDYGRTVSRQVGFVPKRELAGFPRTRNTAVVPRRNAKPLGKSAPTKRGPLGKGTGFGVKTTPHVSKIMRSPNLGHVPKIKMPHLSPMMKPSKTSPLGRSPQLQGFADMGEPMAGNMSHAHIDPVTWFKPPSLTKRNLDERVPTDDPRESNDKYGDVTKRNSKDTLEQKYKMLKRSAPGGLPPAIPARTTALEPHQAFYMPLSQIFSSSTKTPKKVLKGSNFTSFTRRGCI